MEGCVACKQVPTARIKGLATGWGEKRSARCTRREWKPEEQPPRADLLRITGRKKPKIVHPKATTGIMSSEAVEEKGVGVGGEKRVCLEKFLFKI